MDEKLLADALAYYRFGARQVLIGLPDQYHSHQTVVKTFNEFYGATLGTESSQKSSYLLAIALRQFITEKVVDFIDDQFTAPFFRPNDATRDLPSIDRKVFSVAAKYDALGPSGGDWLEDAIASISRRFQIKELSDYYKKLVENVKEAKQSANEGQNEEEETWEPLKIERTGEAYTEAVESSEAALREIESSNGYAASEPEERNSIVAILKGTIESIKSGMPSRAGIKEGLLKPLRYIAKKFPDATIGEIAKLAIGKIITWLATLL